jgi:hypothetical protein
VPKRSNGFQRLVHLIESTLAADGIIVRESEMIASRHGDEREVDVAVHIPGVHPVLVAVESRDHGRRGDTTWIDSLIGKYDGMPVARIVAVHRRGFTKGALKKAADSGIECVTLEHARQEYWLKQLGQTSIELRGRIFKVEGLTIIVERDASGAEPVIDMPSAFIHTPGGKCMSVQTLVETAHNDQAVTNKVHDYVMANDVLDVVQQFTIELSLPSAALVSDAYDRTYQVKEVELAVSAISRGCNAEYAASNYAHSQVAHFSEQVGDFEMNGVMSEPVAGVPKVGFRVHLEKPLAWPGDTSDKGSHKK